MSSTLKIPLLILGAWLIRVALKSPNPPAQAKKGDKVILSTSQETFEKYVKYWAILGRNGNSGLLLSEAALLALLHYGTAGAVPKQICPRPPSKEELSTMPPVFVFGMTCVILGGLLRIWCFRTLGKLFTFEISIRPGHKLVTQGPYSVVRHPSYLALALVYAGMITVEASPNGYLTSCGLLTSFMGRGLFLGWITLLVWFAYSLVIVRPAVEDRNLRAAFGKEWEEYRERVPFKLIPGIF